MGKKDRGAMQQLDSLTDITTCMLGCFMMIVLLTGVDAASIKVLIPTPMQHPTDKQRIYIECRNEELFLVPVDDMRRQAREALATCAREAQGDTVAMMRLLSEKAVQGDVYRVDLGYALVGQFALAPLPGTKGYSFSSVEQEWGNAQGWYARILLGMNKEQQMLTFLVRDDSYGIFKRARALAWMEKVEASYELLDIDDQIKFGVGGSVSLPQ